MRFATLSLALLVAFAPRVWSEDPVPAAGEADPARVAAKPAETPDQVALAHILVTWQGSRAAAPGQARTKEQAKARADQLVALARTKGSDFKELARRFSDDQRSASHGGVMGVATKDQLPPPLATAAFAMGEGQISDAIETEFGYHVLRRGEMFSASHILLMYKGSRNAPPNITRTKEEAQKAMEDILAKLGSGTAFADLARQFSDCPSKARGGALGSFGAGMMVPEFETATTALKEGETSGIVESPFGFHVILRTKIEKIVLVRASHILISHKEAPTTGSSRTKEEARALAEKLLGELKGGKDFAELARANSDCPSKAQGGDLGTFKAGSMVPEFEAAAFQLKPGEISGVVETMFGFHLIKRTE